MPVWAQVTLALIPVYGGVIKLLFNSVRLSFDAGKLVQRVDDHDRRIEALECEKDGRYEIAGAD